MHVSATSVLAGRRGAGILFILALAALMFAWGAHRDDHGPHSVTVIGISEPGSGAGLYNGLRAKSIPAVTDISRIEQSPSDARVYSFMQTEIVQ